ncbi:MAG: hypothetical protein H7Y42_14440 [Chitinophagaceae bacterium]|nr:hypothetical protein [Chitinophagaceae bacterium]
MNIIYLALLSMVMFSGCASIDQSLLLNKGTKVEIIDVSKNPIISGDVSNDHGAISKRIIEYTKEELTKRSIETITENTAGAAKLKYDIRNVSKGFIKYEVKYRVTFETSDGKKIFTDIEDKDDSDIEVIFERIASRTAKFVSSSFK